jgi:hypothetical protein
MGVEALRRGIKDAIGTTYDLTNIRDSIEACNYQ